MAVRHWIGVLLLVIIIIVAVNTYANRYFDSEARAFLFRGQFVAIIETLIFIGTRYIWSNVRDALADQSFTHPSHGRGGSNLFKAFCRTTTRILLGLCLSAYPIGVLLVSEEPYLISMICFICLGTLVQLVISIFVFNRLANVFKYFRRGSVSLSLGKQYRISVMLAVIYSFLMVSFGVYFVTQPPVIKFEQIAIDKLPEELDGFRIVQISDVHLGPTVGKSKFSRIVDMVNQQKPDAVVMVGDFVDSPVYKLRKASEPARHLKAPKGVYFVSGNHEYHTADVDAWFAHWRSLGITVLHNEHATIHSDSNPDARLCMAGIDDIDATRLGYKGHGMDLDTAVRGCSSGYPIVLLAHQPKAAKKALDSEHDIQLVLSGHTHGGQFFPMNIFVYLVNPFFSGLYQYKNGHVYVSQGSVYWGIPMRVGTQHEITVIILRSSRKFL